MATTVAQLENKLNAAIIKYDASIASINLAAETLKTSVQEQSERDAKNATQLLETCNNIARTARETISNAVAQIESLLTDTSAIRTDLNAAIAQIKALQGNLMGEEPGGLPVVDLMRHACKVANITEFNDPEAAAAYQQAHNQLIEEFAVPPEPEPTPTKP